MQTIDRDDTRVRLTGYDNIEVTESGKIYVNGNEVVEIFLPIKKSDGWGSYKGHKSYEDKLMISNLGNIREVGATTNRPEVYKKTATTKGKPLCNLESGVSKFIQDLVMETFLLQFRGNKTHPRQIDGDINNNKTINLIWMTGGDSNKLNNTNPNNKGNGSFVYKLDMEGNPISEYKSYYEAALDIKQDEIKKEIKIIKDKEREKLLSKAYQIYAVKIMKLVYKENSIKVGEIGIEIGNMLKNEMINKFDEEIKNKDEKQIQEIKQKYEQKYEQDFKNIYAQKCIEFAKNQQLDIDKIIDESYMSLDKDNEINIKKLIDAKIKSIKKSAGSKIGKACNKEGAGENNDEYPVGVFKWKPLLEKEKFSLQKGENGEEDERYEIIRNINGFDFNPIRITSYGRIYNERHEFYYKSRKTDIYLRINISDITGKKHTLRVHRLVAMVFKTNSNPKQFNVVNHIDEDTHNNKKSNLEWTDQKGNVRHSLGRKIHRIELATGKIIQFNSVVEAAENNENNYSTLKTYVDSNSAYNGYKYESIEEKKDN